MTNFIDFLATRKECTAAAERLGVALQCLDALERFLFCHEHF